jgi:phosphopantothenoylcysteine decarboxylase/phosphopantothenate--cysteine ligase
VIQDKGVENKSSRLVGKRVGFGICGGIGAVETIKLIRELRRHGADITVFLTPSATRFVTRLSVEWAAQGKVIEEAGADVDHLDPFDVIVVAPLTWNTLAKAALGLTENPVALALAGQFGRKGPVALVPAMNLQLSQHPLYGKYASQLESWGAHFYPSPEEEGRLKMPTPVDLAEWLMEVLNAN